MIPAASRITRSLMTSSSRGARFGGKIRSTAQTLRITSRTTEQCQQRSTNRTIRSISNRAICVEGCQMPLEALTRTQESGMAAYFGFEEDDDGT